MKFPVLKAIGATFAFMVQNFVDLLKIIWLPLVLQWAAYLLLMPGLMNSTSAMASMRGAGQPSPEQMAAISQYAMYTTGLTLVSAVFSVIMFSGVSRLVVRGLKPTLPFYIGWGADEWRVLGSWLILFVVFVLLSVAGGIAMALGAVLTAMGPGPGGIISIVAVAAVVLVGIWLCARLSLAVPASVDLQKIGVGPSWSATEDHLWSIIGFWILFAIIALLVQFVAGAFLTPPGYREAMQGMMSSGNPEDIKRASEEMNAVMLKSYDLSDMGNVIRLSLGFMLGAVGVIVTAVAGAVAWRFLTDKTEPEVFS